MRVLQKTAVHRSVAIRPICAGSAKGRGRCPKLEGIGLRARRGLIVSNRLSGATRPREGRGQAVEKTR